jgi:hypothetical protein
MINERAFHLRCPFYFNRMSNYKIELEIVELERKNFHLFVNVIINKIEGRLLVDTGASKTVMDSERVLRFIKQDKVKPNESKSVGLGVTEMETHIASLPKFRIGKLELNKYKVAVLPLGHVNSTYSMLQIPPIDGVLGSDFLMKYKAVIDYSKSVLKLGK